MELIRLQKYLADAGVASRRKAEELIAAGRVSVDGKTVTEAGTKVSGAEIIEVDGKKVVPSEKKVYIMLNKPEGIVSTVKDQFSRKSVIDMLDGLKERVYPVGRLDYDTSGLLLLTNDGDLAFKLTHPSHGVDKKYVARISGTINENELKQLENGVKIDDYITSRAKVKILKTEKGSSRIEITIHEGKNRQVRKMLETVGKTVLSLKRVEFGGLNLEGLPEGRWRYLSDEEVLHLKRL